MLEALIKIVTIYFVTWWTLIWSIDTTTHLLVTTWILFTSHHFSDLLMQGIITYSQTRISVDNFNPTKLQNPGQSNRGPSYTGYYGSWILIPADRIEVSIKQEENRSIHCISNWDNDPCNRYGDRVSLALILSPYYLDSHKHTWRLPGPAWSSSCWRRGRRDARFGRWPLSWTAPRSPRLPRPSICSKEFRPNRSATESWNKKLGGGWSTHVYLPPPCPNHSRMTSCVAVLTKIISRPES